MFVNQVSGGEFYTTNVNTDNVSATNVSCTNLTTTTFSPVNVNASVVIANEGDIDVINSSTINTSVVNTSTASHATINTSQINASNGNISALIADTINIPSGGAYQDGVISKLSSTLNIVAGGNEPETVIAFTAQGNTSLIYNGDLNILSQINLENSSGHSSNISHDSLTGLNIIANDNVSSDINFYTQTGGTNKLSIKRASDLVEMVNVDVSDQIECTTLLADLIDTDEINASTVNVSDNLRVYSDATKSVQFQKAGNNFNIIGNPDALGAGSDTTFNFYTNQGTGAPALTLRKADDKILGGDIELTGDIDGTGNCAFSSYNSSLAVGIDVDPFVTDTMTLSHINSSSYTNYGFSQNVSGLTSVNSSEEISFKISNTRRMYIDQQGDVFVTESLNASDVNSSTLNTSTLNVSTKNASTVNSSTLNAEVVNSSTLNTSTMNVSTKNASTINSSTVNTSNMNASVYNSSLEVGLAIPFVNDTMVLSHPNCATKNDYCLSQDEFGFTHLNSSTSVELRVDNVKLFSVTQGGNCFAENNMEAISMNCLTDNTSTTNASTVNTSTLNASTFATATMNVSTLNSSDVNTNNISVLEYGSALLGNATANQVLLDAKSGSENLLTFWDSLGGGGSIHYPAWKTDSGTYDDINFMNMVSYHNDGTPANRNVSFVCPVNISNELNVSGRNITDELDLVEADTEHLDLVAISTGLISGGHLSFNAGTDTFNISAGTAIKSRDVYPNYIDVSWNDFTNVTATHVAAARISYVSINVSGAIVQSVTRPDESDFRENTFIGVLVHVNNVVLDNVNQEQQYIRQPATQLIDLWESIGFINVNNVLSGNADLTFNKADGYIIAHGVNYHNNPNAPNKLNLPAYDSGVTQFEYVLQDGVTGGFVNFIDPDVYDNAGTPTAVPNNKWTIQHVWTFVSGNVKIVYGQNLYSSLALARENYLLEDYVNPPSFIANGMFLGHIFVKKGETSLQSADTLFINAGKFDFGSGSASTGGGTLQSAYDNSPVEPLIKIDTLPVSIEKASGVADIFEVRNSTDTASFLVKDETCDVDCSGSFSAKGYFQTNIQSTDVNALTRKDYVDQEVNTKQDTLTTSTEIIGNGLAIDVGNDENCILGKTVAGYTGWGGFSGLIHYDLYGGANPRTFSILQSSAGKTLVNSASGESLNLRIDNTDAFVISSDSSCKAYGELDHKANIYTRTCNGSPTAPTGTVYYPDYNVAGFNGNSNIYGTWTTPSATSTTGLQVLKTGYYRIEAKMNWHTVTYADRYQVWSRILINNSPSDESAHFCYGRHTAYIKYASNTINHVVSLTANDWVKFDSNLCKNSTTFNASWDVGGIVDRFGFDNFSITFLGV